MLMESMSFSDKPFEGLLLILYDGIVRSKNNEIKIKTTIIDDVLDNPTNRKEIRTFIIMFKENNSEKKNSSCLLQLFWWQVL